MKKIIILIFLNLFISHQLIADDYINFSEGDTFESEINFNKTTSGADGFKIPLPQGKFELVVKSRLTEHEYYLIFTQAEKDQLNWWIEVGFVPQNVSGTLDEDACKKKSWHHYHSQTYKKNKIELGYFCYRIQHWAMPKKNEMFVPDGVMADSGKNYKEYLLNQNFDRPDVALVSNLSFLDNNMKRQLYLYYFINPDSFGVTKQEFETNLKLSKKFRKSNFNKKKLSKNPQHKKFIEDFKEISDDLLKRFNQLNNVNKAIAIN